MKIFTLAILLVLSSNLLGQSTLSIPFDNANPTPPSQCFDSWTENSIQQYIIPLTSSCYVQYSSGELWLAPGKMYMDVRGLGNIISVDFDIFDSCGPGCSKISIFDNTNLIGYFQNPTTGLQTFTWNNSINQDVQGFSFESNEGSIREVIITYNPYPTCQGSNYMEVEDSNIYIDNSCNGLILTSPNGNCNLIKINDQGELYVQQVGCP